MEGTAGRLVHRVAPPAFRDTPPGVCPWCQQHLEPWGALELWGRYFHESCVEVIATVDCMVHQPTVQDVEDLAARINAAHPFITDPHAVACKALGVSL